MRDARVEIDAIVAIEKEAAALAEHAARNVAAPSTGTPVACAEMPAPPWMRSSINIATIRLRRRPPPTLFPRAAWLWGSCRAGPARPRRRGRERARPRSRGGRARETFSRAHTRTARGRRRGAETGAVRVNVQLSRATAARRASYCSSATPSIRRSIAWKNSRRNVMSEQRAVRLIHGFGTGRWKEAVVDYLHKHPLVANVRTASPQEGGGA